MIDTILHDRWRILAHLGHGAMGDVWLAENLEAKRKEAIKILMPSLATDPIFVSRFRREARAINRLRHPNIVEVYDLGQLPEERFYLSMEYADGDAVHKVIKREGAFPSDTDESIALETRSQGNAEVRGARARERRRTDHPARGASSAARNEGCNSAASATITPCRLAAAPVALDFSYCPRSLQGDRRLHRVTAPDDPHALFAALYRELKALAGKHVRDFNGATTLSATAVLHEAYLQFAARSAGHFPDRAHFLAYASRVMRGVLIDYARNRRALKRGGEFHFTTESAADQSAQPRDDIDLARLGDALDELGAFEPKLAEIVDLHFFCGFSFAEIAEQRGTSERTVFRDWRKARLLLGGALAADQ